MLWHVGHFLAVVIQFFLALFTHDERLYKSRLSRPDEMHPLLTREPPNHALLLGTLPNGDFVSAHSTPKMKELGNMLILARTRGGKGLRATSQILSWDSSIVVNDIKGEFRDQTAWWRVRNGGKIYTF